MIVMKFGGAAISNTDNINRICQITKKYFHKNKGVIVVSAMKDVTDKLCQVVNFVRQKKVKKALQTIREIKQRHIKTLYEIDKRPLAVKTESELISIFSRLEYFTKNVIGKKLTPARSDYIVSFGERFSCRLVTNALEMNGMEAYPIDASLIIATNSCFGNAVPLYKKSQNHINKILLPLINNKIIPVITGFVGFAHDGCTTTLGRGGSDLTAAYLANLLNAKALYLWKDVEGFYTNDPHHNSQVKLIKKLSYYKAKKMAKNGAKIIYYKAIDPIRKKRIPIYIKSFINPKSQGTIIE